VQNPKVQPLSEPWAVEARQNVAKARTDARNAADTEKSLAGKIREAERRIETLRAELETIEKNSEYPERLGSLEQMEAAIASADQQAKRMAAIEAEIAATEKKLPLLERLYRQAGQENTSCFLGVGHSRRAGWKALADSMRPEVEKAAALLRRWRLAMEQASEWPNDPKDVGAELLSGENPDNERAIAEMAARLALPEEV